MPMKTLKERLETLEDKFVTHLEESGGIRADLAWLKKYAWVNVAAQLSLIGALSVGLAVYLLNRL